MTARPKTTRPNPMVCEAAFRCLDCGERTHCMTCSHCGRSHDPDELTPQFRRRERWALLFGTLLGLALVAVYVGFVLAMVKEQG